jgi:hypothetical protein
MSMTTQEAAVRLAEISSEKEHIVADAIHELADEVAQNTKAFQGLEHAMDALLGALAMLVDELRHNEEEGQ